MNRVMTAIAISSTTAFLVASSPNVVAAAARADAPQPRGGHETATDRQGETRRILSILTRKIADPMVRRKAADKLVMLDDSQVHLIASLAERLAVDGESPAGGIALLLITALLIVS